MFDKLGRRITEILNEMQLPAVKPVLRDIPFAGRLGLALSNLFMVAREAKPDLGKKELKAYVDELAFEIAARLGESGEFERVEAEKGYVNCFFKPGDFTRELVKNILRKGTDWGKSESAGGRVMVEYSQPNTHKAFHIGHVRNAALGAALVRCFRYAGRETVAANYIGDIGSHVFKSLWLLEKSDEWKKLRESEPSDRGRWLGELYARAGSLLNESRELRNEVWDILKPLNEALSEFWQDEDLTDSLGIDPLVRRIALKEEDLFENRPPNQINEIIDRLVEFNLKIHIEITMAGRIDSAHPSEKYYSNFKRILSLHNYQEIWNRDKEVENIAERWNSKDQNLIDLWQETREWSLDDFSRIYDELGAPFDEEAVFFESQVEEEGVSIVKDLEKMGIVSVSSGAQIVEIDKKLQELYNEPDRGKYRVLVLVRADGASLYGAKDLALAKRKFEDFEIDESIYVVGAEQKFYFQQVFQILRLMGFEQWEKCFHLAYELVMLPGGKISSREGQVILYDDVYRELLERALSVVEEKNPELPDEIKSNVSEEVAKGALLYGMLRIDTNKKINFDFDDVLDFDGRSAPYIQYAATRASSILKKAVGQNVEIPGDVSESDFQTEFEPVEIDLVAMLDRFPRIVRQVVEDKKPIHLASYAYDLAVAFSNFYHNCPVLTADAPVRTARLLMVRSVRITLEASLGLLGIPAPEVM